MIEASSHRRPMLVRGYPVDIADIAPIGVRCIAIDDYVPHCAVRRAGRCLDDPDTWRAAVAHDLGTDRRCSSLERAHAIVDRTQDLGDIR